MHTKKIFSAVAAILFFALAHTVLAVPPNPVPILTGLAPTSTTAGGAGFTLMLTGTKFVVASVVQWNGSPRATTLVTSSTLTAAITTIDLANAGTSSLAIQNPTPGGGISGAMVFTINPPLPPTNAVGFIFANVTSSAIVGSDVTFTIEAVNASGTVDTSFEQGVTLTVGGSGSGGGLVAIVNGIGSATVADNTAETIALGLEDSQSTGLDVSASATIVFTSNPGAPILPPAPTGEGPSPETVATGIQPTIAITFSGMAYLGASVTVIRKDLGLQAAPITEAIPAAADGSFLVELNNVVRLTGQTYLLSFIDKNGLVAQTKAYNIPAQDKLVYGNILVAPTLGFVNASIVASNTPLLVTGYATPGATVELFIDGDPAGTIIVNDPTGKYDYTITTDGLALGRHAIWAIQKYAIPAVEVAGYTNPESEDELFVDSSTDGTLLTPQATDTYAFIPPAINGTDQAAPPTVGAVYTKQAESDFSNQESFTISPLADPKLDLDGDGVVDIGDLSIFLSYLQNLKSSLINFRIVDPNIVQALDFNGDGVVDIKDLDILEAAIAKQ